MFWHEGGGWGSSRASASAGGEPGGAVQFRTDIPLAALEQAAFFRQTRTLLKALHAAGEVRATTTRNLPRKFVAEVLPLIFDEKLLAKIHTYSKVVNEQDIAAIHYARVVAQAAGLVRLYKGRFGVSKARAGLLRDDRAGELFKGLFIAFFRKFNIAYTAHTRFEAHGLQACAAYTLYRLGLVARDWKPVGDLPDEVLLPSVREAIEAEVHGAEFWTAEKLLTDRLLRWCFEWGMLEGCYEQEHKPYKTLKAVRTTPLFAQVLHFDLR